MLLGLIVGLSAQLIDGSLGMAYGIAASSILLSIGIPPPVSSASIHTSEIFTTMTSGFSHYKLGNVDVRIVKRLMVSGIIFGGIGAFVISYMELGILKPIISLYLLIMGLLIISRVFRSSNFLLSLRQIPLIGAVAAFFDATGGGGWGPITTITLVAGGHNPKTTVGSVNFTEFFITAVESAIFFGILGLNHIDIVIGLIIGGVSVAPFAAVLCRRIPVKPLMLLVGSLIIILSAYTLFPTLITIIR